MGASAVESLEVAASRLADAVDDALLAMAALDPVSPRLSQDAHRVACEVADVHLSVRRAGCGVGGGGMIGAGRVVWTAPGGWGRGVVGIAAGARLADPGRAGDGRWPAPRECGCSATGSPRDWSARVGTARTRSAMSGCVRVRLAGSAGGGTAAAAGWGSRSRAG